MKQELRKVITAVTSFKSGCDSYITEPIFFDLPPKPIEPLESNKSVVDGPEQHQKDYIKVP